MPPEKVEVPVPNIVRELAARSDLTQRSEDMVEVALVLLVPRTSRKPWMVLVAVVVALKAIMVVVPVITA